MYEPMYKFITTAALSATLMAAPAFAKNNSRGWEYAKVVSADPVIRQVRVSEPQRECHEEPVTERTVYRGSQDPAAPLFGAIIGGVIGHQFGGGRGKDVATVAGALIGANHVATHGSSGNRVVERTVYETRCSTVHYARYEDRIEGYNVAYRYQGHTYRTWLPYDPGKRMRVRVDVSPVAYRDHLD